MNKHCILCATVITNTLNKAVVKSRLVFLSALCLVFPLCPQESPEPERSNIYRSLVTNTSKEMMCFSDFPMPADYPNFMHNSQVLHYFRLYAEKFDLLRYINFQVIPAASYRDGHYHSLSQHMMTSSLICVSVCVYASDHSEECYAKARFFCVRSVGCGHHKQGWKGRKAHLWCRSGVFRTLHSTSVTPVRLSRLVNKLMKHFTEPNWGFTFHQRIIFAEPSVSLQDMRRLPAGVFTAGNIQMQMPAEERELWWLALAVLQQI